MKKKNSIIFSLFLVIVGATLLSSCATLNDLSTDTRDRYDSTGQVKSGRPNEGGEYTVKTALTTVVVGAMMKKIEKGSTEQQTPETKDVEKPKLPDPQSIMRIEGSLPGLVANFDRTRNLTVNILRDDGTSENQVLLPRQARQLYLPPGLEDYTITYTLGNKPWPGERYSVTTANFTQFPLPKGFKYEKLKEGSMTEYEEIVKLPNDISIPINFGFIGPGL
jgi:hypothetical protein